MSTRVRAARLFPIEAAAASFPIHLEIVEGETKKKRRERSAREDIDRPRKDLYRGATAQTVPRLMSRFVCPLASAAQRLELFRAWS